MSASQEKKKRREQAVEQPVREPEKKTGRGAWIAGTVLVVVVVILAIFFGMVNGGFLHRHATAVTVGSYKLTPAMYNYFYGDVYQTYAYSYGLDSSTPLDQQIYDEESGVTWADHLKEQTAVSIAEIYGVYSEAMANGFQVDESITAAVDSTVASMTSYAASSGAANLSAFLTAYYGTGCNEATYREYMEVQQVASAYSNQHAASLEYSDDEISTYYEENRQTLDTVSYRSFLCSVKGPAAEDGTAIIDEVASQTQAEAFAKAADGSETAFAEQARQYASEENASTYESDNATLLSDQSLTYLPTVLSDWLTDEAREYGETTAIATGTGSWYVVQFIDNWTKYDSDAVDIRHILISGTNDDGSENTEAEARANEILAEFEAGEQTEEAFGELAKANSADSNAASGGLYQAVRPGQMVETFNDWCFDESRQPGDTGIVETQYGFHVMYFVDRYNYANYRTVSAMQSEDAAKWREDLGKAMTITENSFGMRFTNS